MRVDKRRIQQRRQQVRAAKTGMFFCGCEVLLAVPDGMGVDPNAIVRTFVKDFRRKVERARLLNIHDIVECVADTVN